MGRGKGMVPDSEVIDTSPEAPIVGRYIAEIHPKVGDFNVVDTQHNRILTPRECAILLNRSIP